MLEPQKVVFKMSCTNVSSFAFFIVLYKQAISLLDSRRCRLAPLNTLILHDPFWGGSNTLQWALRKVHQVFIAFIVFCQ
jgi:hypothetical protein